MRTRSWPASRCLEAEAAWSALLAQNVQGRPGCAGLSVRGYRAAQRVRGAPGPWPGGPASRADRRRVLRRSAAERDAVGIGPARARRRRAVCRPSEQTHRRRGAGPRRRGRGGDLPARGHAHRSVRQLPDAPRHLLRSLRGPDRHGRRLDGPRRILPGQALPHPDAAVLPPVRVASVRPNAPASSRSIPASPPAAGGCRSPAAPGAAAQVRADLTSPEARRELAMRKRFRCCAWRCRARIGTCAWRRPRRLGASRGPEIDTALRDLLADPAYRVRAAAAGALARSVGGASPAARPAFHASSSRLIGGSGRTHGVWAGILRLGESARPALEIALHDDDPVIRREAANRNSGPGSSFRHNLVSGGIRGVTGCSRDATRVLRAGEDGSHRCTRLPARPRPPSVPSPVAPRANNQRCSS